MVRSGNNPRNSRPGTAQNSHAKLQQVLYGLWQGIDLAGF